LDAEGAYGCFSATAEVIRVKEGGEYGPNTGRDKCFRLYARR